MPEAIDNARPAPLRVAPDRPGPDFDLIDLDVSVTPDIESGAISGTTTISFRSLVDDLRVITLSGNALEVTGVGPGVGAVSNDGEAMAVLLPRPLARGERSSITLQFSGMPGRGLTRGEDLIYTGYFACNWMPCAQDRPGDKATVTLTLNLPEGLSSIGPGSSVARTPRPDGTVAHLWRLERPHSGYLIGFAAGRWQELQSQDYGVTLSILAAVVSPEEVTPALSDTAAMLRFFEDRIFSGHDLPRSKPFPDVYLAAAAAVGVPPLRCAVVEDTITGVTAGVAAGACVFGYSPPEAGHDTPQALRNAGAAAVFTDMAQLPDLLR